VAGNKDLVYSFRINTDDAKGKIPEVVGEAKTSIEGFDGAAQKSADNLTQAMKRAEDAVRRLADPNLTPRQLQKAIVDSTIATDRLKEAMTATQKTGGPIPGDAVAKIKAYEEATSNAADQSARYRDALGDQKARSDMAAKGAESLASSMNSVEGVLAQLKNQTGATSQAVGELGFKIAASAAAFGLGYGAGEKLREIYQVLANKEMPNLSKWFSELVTGADKYTDAEVRAGVITTGRLSQMHTKNQHLQTELELLEKIIPGLTNENLAIANAIKAHAEMATVLARMKNAGQDVNDWAVANAKVIYDALEPAVRSGKLAIEDMSKAERVAYETGKAMSDGHLEQKKALDDLTKSIGENLLKIRERAAMEKSAADSMITDAYRSRDAQIKALNESGLQGEAYNKRKREIVAESARIASEGADKEIAANEKLKKDIEDLALKTDGGADAVKNLGDMYVESQAKKAFTLTQDEALKKLTDALIAGTSGVITKIGESRPAWEGLATDLGKVKTPAEESGKALKSWSDQLLPTKEEAEKFGLKVKDAGFALEELGKKAAAQTTPLVRLAGTVDMCAAAFNRLTLASKGATGGTVPSHGGETGSPGGGGGDTVPSH